MSAFPNILFGPDQELFNTYTDRRYGLGSALYMADGKRFRFGLCGALQVAGTVVQGHVPDANHVLQTPAAAAVGAQSITLAIGNTAAVADQFRDGTVLLTAGNSGELYSYPIDTHPAIAASAAAAVIPLKRGVTVQVAVGTTASSCSLYVNPFWKFIICATAQSSPALGVVVAAVASASYGWVQTRGYAPVRVDSTTIVVGNPVVASSTTAGDVGLLTTANFITNWTVGNAVAIGSSAHTGLVDLRME